MGKIKDKFDMFTYTKKWTTIVLLFCIIWISASYILAACGKVSIAETLGKDVVGLTKAIFCTYIVRAFFDTYAEKNYYLKLYRECHKNNEDVNTDSKLTETESDEDEH